MEITATYCQGLGFISRRVTVALTCNSDSWDFSPENKDLSFENLFNTQIKQIAPSGCRHWDIVSSRLAVHTSPSLVAGFYFPSLTHSMWLATVLHSPVVSPGPRSFFGGTYKEKSLWLLKPSTNIT
jgi:hypothetical protein